MKNAVNDPRVLMSLGRISSKGLTPQRGNGYSLGGVAKGIVMRLPNFILTHRNSGYRSVDFFASSIVRALLVLVVFGAQSCFTTSQQAVGQSVDQIFNDSTLGLMNPEPMALATGYDSTTIGRMAPEASAYGSEKTTFSSGQSAPAQSRSAPMSDKDWYYNGWSGPGYVLLKSGNVLHGDVIAQGNGLLVRLDDTGEINLGSSNVVAVKESLFGLYEHQVSRTVRWEAGEHWNLAKWCLRNGLMDQAFYHYMQLKAVAGRHPSFKRMEAEIKSELLLDPVVKEALQARNAELVAKNPEAYANKLKSAKPVSEDLGSSHRPSLDPSKPNVSSAADTSHLVLDRYTQEFFRQQVYPFLVLKCGQAGCHGGSGQSQFQITRSGAQRNRRTSDTSLASTIQFLVDSNFDRTPLIAKATVAHGTRNDAPLEMNSPADRELLERLRYWHAALHRNSFRPSASPKVAATPVTAGGRETPEFPRIASNGSVASTSQLPSSNGQQVIVEPNMLMPEVGSGLLMLEREIAKLEAVEKARKKRDLHDPAEFNQQFGANP